MDRPPAPKRKKDVRFRSNVPMLHDDGKPVPAEWELFCDKCGYDLTGLTVRRCPECGTRFEPYKIWIARRQKEAGLSFQTPAYVPYLGLLLAFAFLARWIVAVPVVLIPFALLPVYELLAWRYKWEAWTTRTVVILLCAIASITTWTMLP